MSILRRLVAKIPELVQSRCIVSLVNDNIKSGDRVTICKTITEEDVRKFSDITGDTNTVHFDGEKPIVHGALLNGIVSGVIGTKLPGPGAIVVSQRLNFPDKCYIGETISVTVELAEMRKIMKVNFMCLVESSKKIVLEGDARLVIEK